MSQRQPGPTVLLWWEGDSYEVHNDDDLLTFVESLDNVALRSLSTLIDQVVDQRLQKANDTARNSSNALRDGKGRQGGKP